MHSGKSLVKYKYKAKTSETLVKYTVERDEEGTLDTVTVETHDLPRPELKEALEAMADHMVDMIEAPHDWRNEITVLSVTVTSSNDVQGLVITGMRELENSNAPLVINTPHFTREPYNEEDDSDVGIFSFECADALDELERLVIRFVEGERAQQELDFSADGVAVGTREQEPASV